MHRERGVTERVSRKDMIAVEMERVAKPRFPHTLKKAGSVSDALTPVAEPFIRITSNCRHRTKCFLTPKISAIYRILRKPTHGFFCCAVLPVWKDSSMPRAPPTE